MSLSCGMMPLRNATWILEHFTDTEEIQKQTRLHHRSKQETNSCPHHIQTNLWSPNCTHKGAGFEISIQYVLSPTRSQGYVEFMNLMSNGPCRNHPCIYKLQIEAIIREIRLLITDELVEFEKLPDEVQDFRKMIHHTRGIQRIHPTWVKTNRKM